MLSKHLFGMPARGFGNLVATGHTGDFVDALGEIEGPQLGGGPVDVFGFFDPVVLIAMAGDLGEVGDAEDLMRARNAVEFFADHSRGLAANARIHLVKN